MSLCLLYFGWALVALPLLLAPVFLKIWCIHKVWDVNVSYIAGD